MSGAALLTITLLSVMEPEEMTSVHMKMETVLHNSRLQSSVKSMLSEQSSVFRDVRMIMRDGVMFLDIPSTAVIFPSLR